MAYRDDFACNFSKKHYFMGWRYSKQQYTTNQQNTFCKRHRNTASHEHCYSWKMGQIVRVASHLERTLVQAHLWYGKNIRSGRLIKVQS